MLHSKWATIRRTKDNNGYVCTLKNISRAVTKIYTFPHQRCEPFNLFFFVSSSFFFQNLLLFRALFGFVGWMDKSRKIKMCMHLSFPVIVAIHSIWTKNRQEKNIFCFSQYIHFVLLMFFFLHLVVWFAIHCIFLIPPFVSFKVLFNGKSHASISQTNIENEMTLTKIWTFVLFFCL